jgi:hypothetical protein
MLVAASVVTTRHDLLRKRWQLEDGLPNVAGAKIDPRRITVAGRNVGSKTTPTSIDLTWEKSAYRFLAADDLRPVLADDGAYRGTFLVYDWVTKEVVWQENWDGSVLTPTGFVFADDKLYVADSESAAVFVIDLTDDPNRIVRRISHPAFNDCHGIARTSRGLLIACTGTDAIVEVDLDGNLLWEWWAAEHGYNQSPSGHIRISGRGGEHRNRHYHTRFQTTHLNTVCFADPDERYVLATFFHQGLLVRIDREDPSGRAEVLLDGLARPHAIRKIPGGWSLANSWGCEFLLLDERFQIVEGFEYDGGWMQDCRRLSTGDFVLNDVDNHRVVEVSGPPFREVASFTYDHLWRMFDLEEVPARHESAFRASTTLANALVS